MSKHCCNCSEGHNEVRVSHLTLDDGRLAEKHISVDEDGNEVVEVFAEEKRPLKLEKRIHRQFKNVVAKETHETIKDGEVAHVEVRSTESEVPLKVVDRIGIANHAKIVDGDYVRKDEIGKIVSDSVIAGVTALVDNIDPMQMQSSAAPIFKAQSVVEANVADKAKSSVSLNVILSVVLVLQVVGTIAYFCLVS